MVKVFLLYIEYGENMSFFSSDFDLIPSRVIGGTHSYSCHCRSCSRLKELVLPSKQFKISLEMAGTKRDEIKVTLKGETLDVKYSTRLGETKYYSAQVSSKFFDLDKIECKYEDGLLTVTAPLKDQEPEKLPDPPEIKIEIK